MPGDAGQQVGLVGDAAKAGLSGSTLAKTTAATSSATSAA
jgi:hypothetical protein